MSTDYRSTVFLPRTDLPMRANLPGREPKILARWERINLFQRLREAAKGREKFILHDGPPYANGHIHMGTALNKILKDVVNRSQQMLGKDANYVPGWDCHGLPIEWQVEQAYHKAGKDKDAVPITYFRQECREFAEHWIGVQAEEFKRLGVLGDWGNPYTTMEFASEAQIVREIGKFVINGGLYRGSKPVLWSVVEKTALAEAEVEYHDHTSTTIYVRFPIIKTRHALLEHASVIIWTTTPWTIPGNRAIAYGQDFSYKVIDVKNVAEGSLAKSHEALVIADELVDSVAKDVGITEYETVATLHSADLQGSVCHHPLHGKGYDFEVPLVLAHHVTLEQGTGLVHIAPGHGTEDFEVGVRFGLEVPETVDGDGNFLPHVPLFAGKNVFDANDDIADKLAEASGLLARGEVMHTYPHSWRSKAPLIFRNTPQWFISMETNELRRKALAAIDRVRWVPPSARNRIYGMVEERPDWVVSRQRAWGVPLPVFVDRKTGEILRDPAVLERVATAVAADGADVWFVSEPKRFLGSDYDGRAYEKIEDILDVWFESGSTHSFVLETRPDLEWPASLYLEGSDQHRGWFHSSLLEACGTRGEAPYEAVLTHGFVVDAEGRKMSKSLGNVIAPQEVMDEYGADILRIWAVSADYAEDLRISKEILDYQADGYRRLRNTYRYLLANLAGFKPEERLAHEEMPPLERWVLHRLVELDALVRRSCEAFDFHPLFTALHNFCAVDLSAFYFDVRKDSLYCDRPDSARRRAARTVIDALFSCLTAWLAPIICFTTEEAWLHRYPDEEGSVHLRLFPELPGRWRDDALADNWEKARRLRRVVTGALEVERREKRIGSSLDAHPTVYAPGEHVAAMDGVALAEIAITSAATLMEGEPPSEAFTLDEVPGVGVVAGLAEGRKCGRCWQVLTEVGSLPAHADLCRRCADAVDALAAGSAT